MEVKQQLTNDMKEAMKAKEKFKLNIIRMLLSEFKYVEVQMREKGKEPTNDDYIAAIESYGKKIQKSISDMPDRAEDLEKEMAVIKSYLPEKADKIEILPIVDAAIAESEDKNFGKIMKAVAEKLGSRADKALISSCIKEKLG